MKNKLEIELTNIQLGPACRVVGLNLGVGSTDLADYLEKLKKSNHVSFNKLRGRFITISKHESFENEKQFRKLKGHSNLYEVKISKPSIRIYAFYDTIEGMIPPTFIILACGGSKGDQTSDITKAAGIKSKYFERKSDANVILHKDWK